MCRWRPLDHFLTAAGISLEGASSAGGLGCLRPLWQAKRNDALVAALPSHASVSAAICPQLLMSSTLGGLSHLASISTAVQLQFRSLSWFTPHPGAVLRPLEMCGGRPLSHFAVRPPGVQVAWLSWAS
jgi:hypothetical protein